MTLTDKQRKELGTYLGHLCHIYNENNTADPAEPLLVAVRILNRLDIHWSLDRFPDTIEAIILEGEAFAAKPDKRLNGRL